MRGRWGFAAGLVMLAACQEQVFEPVKNGLVATAALDGDVVVTTKADILFVIDDSTSMGNEQQKLAAGFPALLAKLEALDPKVDYRIGVLTTSVDEHFGPCDSSDPTAPASCASEFGGTGFECVADACLRTFPQESGHLMAAPGNPAILDRANLNPQQLAQMFAQNVQVGTNGSRQEQPLRAFESALNSGGLKDFLRDDARLVLLIASDEDDCSDSTGKLLALEDVNGTFVDRCQQESTHPTGKLDDLAKWEHRFTHLEAGGHTREVAIGAIVGLDPTTAEPATCVDQACAQNCQAPANQQACQQQCQGSLRESLCVNECMQQCVDFCGSQSPGWRTARVVRDLNGPLASICESDFGPALGNLARVLGIPTEIDLPSVPGDSGGFFFLVTRGGHQITCEEGRDYSIDRTSHPPQMQINQTGQCKLEPGDHWSIRYLTKV